jgi:hypothetical protein
MLNLFQHLALSTHIRSRSLSTLLSIQGLFVPYMSRLYNIRDIYGRDTEQIRDKYGRKG